MKFALCGMITIAIIALICLGEIPKLLFETEPYWGEFIKLIGALIGGILVLWGLRLTNKRVKEQTRQNNISEKAQLNTRFKDAAILLADSNTSANLSGIYALHQIALEASRGDENQRGHVKVIQDILCAFLRENTEKNENTIQRTKPDIVFQTVISVLFSKDKEYIYDNKEMDLSYTDLSNLNLCSLSLSQVNFSGADLSEAKLSEANLSERRFLKASISKLRFYKKGYSEIKTDETYLSGADLSGADLSRANLYKTKFNGASLSGANLCKAYMLEVDFSDAIISTDTNFTDSRLEGSTIEEITKPGNSIKLTSK